MKDQAYPPVECDRCCNLAEPALAWTQVGDGTDRIGAWCRACRRLISIVEEDDLAILHCPPWQWLPVDRLLPEEGSSWPVRREIRNYATEFPFGALAPESKVT